MTRHQWIGLLWVPAALLALFLTAVFFRPLLPIDETRYMSAAWEMYLRKDWLAPLTVNFQPYHHKPPMLFWLINASWSVFGVSRWAGLIPPVLSSLAFVFLTVALAKKLFPARSEALKVLPFLVVGSLPFLVYGTLVMFDITLAVFVLASLLALVAYAKDRKPIFIFLLALFVGLGLLTKGPVAWLYVVFPIFLGRVWVERKDGWTSWYSGCFLALLLSVIPALLWLIPVLGASDNDFAFALLWEQTAGRITGGMENTHGRPLYFYLPLIPVLMLPWAFFPSFWRGIKTIGTHWKSDPAVRFILCWIVPVILAFSFISGKQPHYLLPLLPGVLILIAMLAHIPARNAAKVTAGFVCLFIIGQAIASQTFFKSYDLQPVADYIRAHPDRDIAFVRKYQGELTFLARMHRVIESEETDTLPAWFEAHPDGMAIVRYSKPEKISDYETEWSRPYRGRILGIFGKKP